jgi:hypothetical protein
LGNEGIRLKFGPVVSAFPGGPLIGKREKRRGSEVRKRRMRLAAGGRVYEIDLLIELDLT